MEKQRRILLKKFHVLLGASGGDVKLKKEAILSSYGLSSSRELNAHELLEICTALELEVNPALAESDRLRKRLIAAIGGWLNMLGQNGRDIVLIKAIACRAAEAASFNRIGNDRLRSLYYAFKKKQKDIEFADDLTTAEIDRITSLN